MCESKWTQIDGGNDHPQKAQHSLENIGRVLVYQYDENETNYKKTISDDSSLISTRTIIVGNPVHMF